MEWLLSIIFTAVVGLIVGYLLGNNHSPNKRVSSSGSSDSPLSASSSSSDESSTTASSSSSSISSHQDDMMMMSPTSSECQSSSLSSSFRSGRRLIVVAKQLPVSLSRDTATGKWKVEWDDNRSFLANFRKLRGDKSDGEGHEGDDNDLEIVWVGWPGMDIARDDQDEVEELLEAEGCRPVFLPPQLNDRFSNGFCRGVLWPLLHYTLPQASTCYATNFDDLWQAYTAANTLYATVVSHTVESSNDWIWVHNYHLLLVPGFVRNKLQKAKIGVFLHTPFPSSDVFRLLPTRSALLTAIMASDLIGFHTFDYARHFLSAIKRVLDLDYETLPGGRLAIKSSGRYVSLLISHVGIDAAFFRETSKSLAVQKRVQEIRSQFNGRRIIMGLDDLDLVKGSLLKIQAYERFLNKYPNWASKVVLFEVLTPSRNSASERAVVRDSLFATIRSIQASHGPEVIHVIETEKVQVDLIEMTAMYNSADVAVVSTFWDGLNLIPYEFTASQNEAAPGTLVVSEFMGCSRSLNGVFRVNPWSLENTAEAINSALELGMDERKANHHRRFNYVMNHTVERWADGFLFQLDRAAKLASRMKYVSVGWGSSVRLVGVRADFEHVDEDQITLQYRKAKKRILLLDYDGTLTSAEKSLLKSKLVGPTPAVMAVLKLLSEDPDNTVFIMSGRTRDCLAEWFAPLPELGLAAEKGCFLRWPQRMRLHRYHLRHLQKAHALHSSSTAEAGSPITDHSDDRVGGADSHHSQEDKDDYDEDKSDEHAHDNGAQVKNSPDRSSSSVSNDIYEDDDDYSVDDSEWESMIPLDDITWKAAALEIVRSYTEATDGTWIEDKEFALVWHYEQADPEYGRMQASELQKYLLKVLDTPSVDVVKYDYNRILEVKPKGVSKGIAATAILEAVLGSGSTATVGPYPKSPPVSGGGAPVLNSSSLLSSPNSPTRSPKSAIVSSYSSSSTSSSLPSSNVGTPTAVSPTSASAFEECSPFLLAVGDDRGDEDMFAALQNRDDLNKKNQFPLARRLRRAASSSSSVDSSSSTSNFSSPTNANIPSSTRPSSPVSGLQQQQSVRSPVPVSPSSSSSSSSSHSNHRKESDSLGEVNKKPSDPFTFTVCVGMKPSCAHYYVHDDEEVIKILQALATCSRRIQQSKYNDAGIGSRAQSYPGIRSPNSMPTLTLPSLSMFRSRPISENSKLGLAALVKDQD